MALRDQTHQRGRERNARLDTRTVLDWNVVFRSARLSRSKRLQLAAVSIRPSFALALSLSKGIIISGLVQHAHPNYGKPEDPFYYEV